jgi:hypothetical protein
MGPPVSMSPSLSSLAPLVDLPASANWPAMVSFFGTVKKYSSHDTVPLSVLLGLSFIQQLRAKAAEHALLLLFI